MDEYKRDAVGRVDEPHADADAEHRILLKDRAYQEIKDRILDGRFSPGTFLAERWLADKLGMSKTPVRAAIGRLEAEGYLTVSPQQGIVVREMSVHEIKDHFDMRVALETFVVRKLAGHLSAGQEARLRENLAAQRTYVEARQVAPYVELDADFHLLFCEILDNHEIYRVMERQREKLYRIIFTVLQHDTERMMSSYEEHVALLEHVAAGDGEQAAAGILDHLEYSKRSLITL